jgi:putative nucleotidyltransferase with HDIG domain
MFTAITRQPASGPANSMQALSADSRSVIDALTAHIALIDGEGEIVAVNLAWRRFYDGNGCCLPNYGVGCNYLALLAPLAALSDNPAAPEDSRIAGAVVAGLRSVLTGASERFQLEYPCHAPQERRWFLLTVTPFAPGHRIRAVVSHENITALKLAEERTRQQAQRVAGSFASTVESIALAIEKRDPYTAGHQRQVAALASEIGRVMGLDPERRFALHLGASIHDIGKISVPAEILNRPGLLSEPEYAIIRQHAQTGHEILRGIDFPWPIADMVRQHHERLDGSGYPQGLRADEICLEARIIAVADVFDAIISHRPYRPGRALQEALDELQRGRGTIYDAAVVDAGLHFFAEVTPEWHRQHRENTPAIDPLAHF